MQISKDFNNLYESKTLRYWHCHYAEKVQWIFQELIFQKLTEEESHVLADVHLDLPLTLDAKSPNNPFAFYAFQPFPVVKLPIFTIKYFYDREHYLFLKNY